MLMGSKKAVSQGAHKTEAQLDLHQGGVAAGIDPEDLLGTTAKTLEKAG